jgi:hypothetical protein
MDESIREHRRVAITISADDRNMLRDIARSEGRSTPKQLHRLIVDAYRRWLQERNEGKEDETNPRVKE